MASVEQRLQIKREPIDKWSVREKLCLSSAVGRSGDQNWMSVSRALKSFGEPNRPSDWFHQKNCASQYGALLANVETPKRKKKTSSGDYGIETPAEFILRQLKNERLAELKNLLGEEKAEYLKLQENMLQLSSGNFTEEQLDKWCNEIDEEEYKKEQEIVKHTLWLKERETKKQEIERAWRPSKLPSTPTNSVKRKNSDSQDNVVDSDQQHFDDSSSNSNVSSIQESPKPSLALSPLLTSLLKSPSQVQNINQSSILHSAITNQRALTTVNTSVNTSSSTNPMIASLLNSTANVTVSPGLQQLVSTAIGQETENIEIDLQQSDLTTPDILDDESLRNLKIEDIANSIIVPDGPLPEMKNEVDVIISDLIADPEQHLQLDNNGDININLELDDLDENEDLELEHGSKNTVIKEQTSNTNTSKSDLSNDIRVERDIDQETEKLDEKTLPPIDPFEFQEDPEYEPIPLMKQPDNKQVLSQCLAQPQIQQQLYEKREETELAKSPAKAKEDICGNDKSDGISSSSGSVEIVEVAMEEAEIAKILDKTQIRDIVHSNKVETLDNSQKNNEERLPELDKLIKKEIIENLEESETVKMSEVDTNIKSEIKEEIENENTDKEKESNVNLPLQLEKTSNSNIDDTNISEGLYDDVQMEIKVDKSGKIKRDYSRTRKKEEKDFDILLAIEKAHMEDNEISEEFPNREFSERKDCSKKEEMKSENERSSSPWTEEEDITSAHAKRRISTATPNDSVPNSPASGSAYCDDDKDYRNWKKSNLLVYSWLAAHKYSSLFLKPITEDQAPGYHSLVYRPMDFQTIRKNIESGVIRTTEEFKRDVMLMLQNAIMYNKTNGTVYNMTKELQQEGIESFDLLLRAQSSEGAPLRRETRTSEPGLKRKRCSEDNTRNKKRKDD